MPDSPADVASPAPAAKPQRWKRRYGLIVVAVALVLLARWLRQEISIDVLAAHEAALRGLLQERPLVVYAGAFALYALATGLSLPGAAVILSLAYGWFFQFWTALIIVSFGSTLGATGAFLFARYFLRDAIQSRFGDRLAKFNAALEQDGAFYLFTLRLIPQVPFALINLVMGLSPISVWTFWWVSQLGMLPGTAVYISAGASIGSLEEIQARGVSGLVKPQTILAFTVLGLFPLIVKWIFNRTRRPTT